ncbi:hypothetical protein ACHQM5_017144 [Ranunculus cassubicifolius]
MRREEEGEAIIRSWIESDENAFQMLGRVLTRRPTLLLPPPLHRVPLRLGNVLEITGPSPSAKTLILTQAAISCILPKEWKNGIHYGGLERLAVYLDLDCRFDILRLHQSLKHRIAQTTNGSSEKVFENPNGDFCTKNSMVGSETSYDEELFLECMRRFMYVRCYSSVEFLATLKTLHNQLQNESKKHGVDAHFLMIDSIGSFYWIDRASTPMPVGIDKRKNMSVHTVVENVVEEIRKLQQVQPMLVLATKATILGDASSDFKRNLKKSFWRDATELASSRGSEKQHSYREYMPSIWQLFITHRIVVHVLDEEEHLSGQNQTTFASEWLVPSLGQQLDKFQVNDAGVYMLA